MTGHSVLQLRMTLSMKEPLSNPNDIHKTRYGWKYWIYEEYRFVFMAAAIRILEAFEIETFSSGRL